MKIIYLIMLEGKTGIQTTVCSVSGEMAVLDKESRARCGREQLGCSAGKELCFYYTYRLCMSAEL